jgi:hypothetical protein
MANHYHALVWIDHRVAKVFHFNVEHSDRDHPSDGALLALERRFFKADDRMRSQIHA